MPGNEAINELNRFVTVIASPSLLQTWKNNMGVAGKASINSSKSDYTKVTFKPDLSKFKMTHLDRDTVGLMTRRAYDIAGCTKGVAVYLNGKKLPVSGEPECQIVRCIWRS